MTGEQQTYEYRTVVTHSGRVLERPTADLQLALEVQQRYITPTHIERRIVGPWEKVEL